MVQKINNILIGWKNVVFESKEIEQMARSRAIKCAKCEHAVTGWIAVMIEDSIEDIEGLKCGKCDCPLSALLRSPDSKCKLNKWQANKK